jgi:DMSO/TMAO reductase YedYZ molybdopterin-dependent catalytic subunit
MSGISRRARVRLTRRELLRGAAGLGAAAALGGAGLVAWPAGARAQDFVPGKERMIVRSLRYLNLEAPAHLLDSFITPVELFYVRNHLAFPGVDIAAWRLRVTGEVERELELDYEELARMEPDEVVNTLECAGNGRAFHRPRVAGLQWVRGAVGTARFAGPRLADVLRRAGLQAGAKHVAFDGLDVPPGQVPDFVRSIPLEKALDAHTLLATHMNGAPLTIHHGFPVRVLVPGWLGAASVKWLAEIRVLDREFDGNFMKPGYRMPKRPLVPGGAASPEETAVITDLPVKSIITRPGDGAHLRGPIEITGVAWAGETQIARVEVSADGGRTWREAELGAERARFAWRHWRLEWQPSAPGSHVILSRATDLRGHAQPFVAEWNPSGYLWNAVDRVRVNVEA